MVKIISEGKVIAICDEPKYIKVKPSTGVYIQTDEKHAQGIIVLGTLYNLPGHTEISGMLYNEETKKEENIIFPEAFPMEIDGGALLISEIKNLEGKTNNMLCNIDIDLENIKDALCELDEKVDSNG